MAGVAVGGCVADAAADIAVSVSVLISDLRSATVCCAQRADRESNAASCLLSYRIG